MSISFVSSMYLYLGEGTVITVTNTLLLACILGKKRNRERREFLLIAVQALADTCYAVAFMLIARHRLLLAAEGRENGNSTVWECAISPALPLHNWATPLLGLLPLTTSLNFFACSTFPIWYLRQTELYTAAILAAPHVLALVLSVLNYVLLWGDMSPTPAMCVAAKGAAHPIAYGIMLAMRILANMGSALIYGAILLYLRRARKTSLQEMTAQQLKTHRNATITLGCVTLNSILLLFIPDVLLFFNPGNISKDYSTLLYSMTLSKTTINFFIYMWRYKELKDMVFTMTCRRLPQLKKYFPERISRTSVAPTGTKHSVITRRSSMHTETKEEVLPKKSLSKKETMKKESPPKEILPKEKKEERNESIQKNSRKVAPAPPLVNPEEKKEKETKEDERKTADPIAVENVDVNSFWNND